MVKEARSLNINLQLKLRFKKHLAFVALVFLASFLPLTVNAASLSFAPSSGSYSVGTNFSVDILVSSSDQAINAASGSVSFPWDKLEVVSISKTGSIFSLWPAEPNFSNSAGTVSFEGIVLNPGFTGTNGKVASVTFKVKREGQANFSFASGSVLANDGSGTNILSDFQVATATLIGDGDEDELPISRTPVTSQENELGISSKTHPNQTKWYADPAPEFVWTLPPGVLEIRTTISQSSAALPRVSYIPPISNKKVDDLADGTYYFSVQVKTASGWGRVSRFRVNIDTTPPKPFFITFPHGKKNFEPQPVIFFNTTDGGSGVSHYDIKIGTDGKPQRSGPLASSNPYVLPAQNPGSYTLLVTAIDNAGNARSASTEFEIESIDVPQFIQYPQRIEDGDILKIQGTTYPSSDITLYVREGDKLISEEFTRSNTVGDFILVVTKRLEPGTYSITARVTDGRGARSSETEPIKILVKSRVLSGLINVTLNFLSIALLAIFALGAIIFTAVYIWRRSNAVIRRAGQDAEEVVERSMAILKSDVREHIYKLKKAKQKRELTTEEVDFLEHFEGELADAETAIEKKIKRIIEK